MTDQTKIYRLKECFACKGRPVVAKDKRTARLICKRHLYLVPRNERESVNA